MKQRLGLFRGRIPETLAEIDLIDEGYSERIASSAPPGILRRRGTVIAYDLSAKRTGCVVKPVGYLRNISAPDDRIIIVQSERLPDRFPRRFAKRMCPQGGRRALAERRSVLFHGL